MGTLSYFIQPESSNNYFTWNASYALSQSSTGSPGNYQKWDFSYDGYYISLGNPKSNNGDVFTYLKYDGTNLYQNPFCDMGSIWLIEPNMSYTWYNIYNVQNGKYLGVDTSTFKIGMFSSTGTNTEWKYGSQVEWGSNLVNPLYVTISSTNYYLVADLDGYSLQSSTSLSASNPCYEWCVNDAVTSSTVAPYYQSEYLTSNGDGTLSVTNTQDFWTSIPLAADYSVSVLQSINNGFLQFNSDGSTMSEYITTPTPYPGALGTKCQLRLSETSFLMRRKELAKEGREKRLAQAEKARKLMLEKGEEVVSETPKEVKPAMGSDFLEKLNKLESLGFTNRAKNIEALIQTRADVKSAIKILVDSTPSS